MPLTIFNFKAARANPLRSPVLIPIVFPETCEATALQSFGDSAPWEHLAGVGFVTCPMISSDVWNVVVAGLGESSWPQQPFLNQSPTLWATRVGPFRCLVGSTFGGCLMTDFLQHKTQFHCLNSYVSGDTNEGWSVMNAHMFFLVSEWLSDHLNISVGQRALKRLTG